MVNNGPKYQRGGGTQWTSNPGNQHLYSEDSPMKTTLRRLSVAWSLVIFLLLPALTRAETAVQAWLQRYNGPINGLDHANAVAVDGSNNVIVTGDSAGFGGGPDYATIKYSPDGVPLWTNRYNGPNNSYDRSYAVAVDGSNNVIVTGHADYASCATIKYSSVGVPLWTNLYYGPTGSSRGNAVAADSSNNVIVTVASVGSDGHPDYPTIKYSAVGVPIWTNHYNQDGSYWDRASVVLVDGSNNVIVTGDFGFNYATLKYSSAGVPLWTNCYNGPGNYYNRASAVAVDASNSVIVTGSSYGSGASFNYDYATLKYSSAGVPLWTNRYNGSGNGHDIATAVAVDGSNNVLVTGYSTNGASGYDYATIKYSSGGAPLWTNRYNGPGDGDDGACAVAVAGSNSVIVTGYSTNNASGYDYATIKYSSAGVALWTNRYNGPANGDDYAASVTVDRSGNVIVTGTATVSGRYSDFATVKYICVPEPVMTGLPLTNGAFQLRVDDVLQPGTLVIESCTNLSATNWAGVFTNTTPTNVLFYADPDAGNRPARFYRAFQFP
jgi:hypothetical protein